MISTKKLIYKILQTMQGYDSKYMAIDEILIKEVSFTTATNSSVSPFGAYCEVQIGSGAPSGYTAIAVSPIGSGSANPVLCRLFNNNGSFFAYSKSAVTMPARIIYKKTIS